MTNEDLIQGLKEQRIKSMARTVRLLEKVCKAEHQDLEELLTEVGGERNLCDLITQELQNLGGA